MTSQADEARTMLAVTGGHGRGPGGQLALPYVARCPVPGCRAQIDPSRLMCGGHWYSVPKQIRDRVWATWLSGLRAFASEHRAAVLTAIASCGARGKESGEFGRPRDRPLTSVFEPNFAGVTFSDLGCNPPR